MDVDRSAAPWMSSGTAGARAFMTFPAEARVAIDSPTGNSGMADSQPAGRRPSMTRANSAASSAWAAA